LFRHHPLAAVVACTLLFSSGPAASDICAQSSAIRLTDDAGRQLVLAAPPTRIVSLVPVATEILFSLGEGDRLAGRSRFDDYPPEVSKVPDVGDAIRPSVESVLLRRPDLVILIGGSDNSEAVREMDRLQVPYAVVLFNTLDDLRTNIFRLGRLVERVDSAAQLWAGIEAGLEAVRVAVEGRPRPGVYYDVGYPPAFTVGAGSYLDTLLTTAGGRNVFGDLASPSPRVSLEAILDRDPDVIVFPVSADSQATSAGLGERPGWENLRAVRAGAVVGVPAEVVHRLGPRVAEAARLLAVALHPEILKERQP
jgi:iron complex transport system substrate-binding protein